MIDFFVNYRSSDTPHLAALLAQSLGDRVGMEKVFLDTASLQAGDHFPQRIWAAVNRCHTLVVLIGPVWLAVNGTGRRRIDDDRDYVRREIARALEREIRVVPVLVDEAVLPSAEELPADVAGVVERQGHSVRSRHQLDDVAHLVDALVSPPGGEAGGPTTAAVSNTFEGPVTAGVIGINRGHIVMGGTGD
jgi:hypothetical protein